MNILIKLKINLGNKMVTLVLWGKSSKSIFYLLERNLFDSKLGYNSLS